MARKLINHDADYPIHVTSRSNNRDFFPLEKKELWEIFLDYLYLTHKLFDIRILSFVLMDNHFHLLARFPKENVSACLEYFLRETSKEIGRRSSSRNHQFGGRHYKCSVQGYLNFLAAYKYIYRNPVEAGLCQNAEDYPFSTLAGFVGRSRLPLGVEPDPLLIEDLEQTIRWINYSPGDHAREAIRKALRRQQFKISRSKNGFSADHYLDFPSLSPTSKNYLATKSEHIPKDNFKRQSTDY